MNEQMVKHTYVVEMIEVLASKTKIFIVLELVTGGELFDKIVQVGKLSEDQARFYFNQLIEGVAYCHQMGVCHRDLKPEVKFSSINNSHIIPLYTPYTPYTRYTRYTRYTPYTP